MSAANAQINLDAPAVLKKWPSRNNERVSATLGGPYTTLEGTLYKCVRRFMDKPIRQRHLYEIHTAPQTDLVRAVMSAEHIVEIARRWELIRSGD